MSSISKYLILVTQNSKYFIIVTQILKILDLQKRLFKCLVHVVGSSPIKGPRCFLEQETLRLLLSTGWFQ